MPNIFSFWDRLPQSHSLHLHTLHMWYFPGIDDIYKNILRWEENHCIYIIVFWGVHIFFSLTVSLYSLAVDIHRKCQHSNPANIFGNNLCKVCLFPYFRALNGCWVGRRIWREETRGGFLYYYEKELVLKKYENSICREKSSLLNEGIFSDPWRLSTTVAV